MTQIAQVESNLPAPAWSCGEAVDLLRARHGWQLLDRPEFVRRPLAHLETDGAEGPERQNLGYTELFRYLYDSARPS